MSSDFFSDFISVLWKLNPWPQLCLCHALPVELQEWLRCKPNTYYANQTWVVVFGTADDSYCVLSKAKIVCLLTMFHTWHPYSLACTNIYACWDRCTHLNKHLGISAEGESSLSMPKNSLMHTNLIFAWTFECLLLI